jgi:hypothetical protein
MPKRRIEDDEMQQETIDLKNPETNTYEMVKARFELECCKVEYPFCYARNVPDSDPYLHSHNNLKQFYCDWKYWKLDMCNTYKKFPFISAWLQDPRKRVVETLESINKDPARTLKELNFKSQLRTAKAACRGKRG